MNFIGLVIFANALGSIMAKDCKTTDGSKTCLRRDQMMSSLRQYMADGDPCFTYGGSTRYCFTKKNGGRLSYCECKPECGCGSTLPPAPKCDNSKAPSSFEPKCGYGYGLKNTMCIYRGMGPMCKDLCNRGLTEEEKQKILKKHNDLRRKVAKGQQPGQPSAANMNELVWDDDLEKGAQRWADQCVFEHDNIRSTKEFKNVGQNIAWYGNSWNSADKQVEESIQSWYNEVNDFHSGIDIFTATGNNTGVVTHYTGLVWAKTKKVGCGFTQYQGPKWIERLLICNYGAMGNWLGEPVYNRGRPGSECRFNNDGLCA